MIRGGGDADISGVGEIDIHGRLHHILFKNPTVAILIDTIPKGLREWAETLRNPVNIWVIEKFVSVRNPRPVLYAVPDENVPTLTTVPTVSGVSTIVRASASQVWRDLLDAMPDLLGPPVCLEDRPVGLNGEPSREPSAETGSRARVWWIHRARPRCCACSKLGANGGPQTAGSCGRHTRGRCWTFSTRASADPSTPINVRVGSASPGPQPRGGPRRLET
jgi:hypothetical protein